jgi:hypothetical protein
MVLLFNVSTLSVNGRADGWVNLEVLSFDGENIQFRLDISVVGNHTDDQVWIGSERPSSNGVKVEVYRGISNVVFYEGSDLTIFTYHYSFNHTYYEVEPKAFGYPLFPWDTHRLTLVVDLSFNASLDEHPSVCDVPSQNYQGRFSMARSTSNPTRYTLQLEIYHSPSFVSAVAFILCLIIVSLYALSFTMIVFMALVILKRRARDLIPNLIRISSAMLFFVPAFEIAFNNLKSPLPLVFPDLLILPVVPLNAGILIAGIIGYYIVKN